MTIFITTRKCIMALATVLWLSVSAYALELDTNDAFVVSDVPVRATLSKGGVTAGNARQAAIETGALHAFTQLAWDVLTEDDFARLPELSYTDVQNTIRGYQLGGENFVVDKYSATISYAFYKQQVESLLESYDIVLAEYHKEPILVIPLLQWDDEYLLWQGENPWQHAWNQVSDSHKTWFVNVPLGDVDDLSLIHISDVLSNDYTVLKKLQKRYDARYLVVAEAKVVGKALSVQMEVLGEGRDAQYVSNYTLSDDTDLEKLMYRASFDAGRYLYNYRKNRSTAPTWYDTTARLIAADHKTRVQLLGYFDSLHLVDQVTIQEVSAGDIVVVLRHSDAPDTLRAYLENEGLLVEVNNEIWQVSESDEQGKKIPHSPSAFLEQHLPNTDFIRRVN